MWNVFPINYYYYYLVSFFFVIDFFFFFLYIYIRKILLDFIKF